MSFQITNPTTQDLPDVVEAMQGELYFNPSSIRL